MCESTNEWPLQPHPSHTNNTMKSPNMRESTSEWPLQPHPSHTNNTMKSAQHAWIYEWTACPIPVQTTKNIKNLIKMHESTSNPLNCLIFALLCKLIPLQPQCAPTFPHSYYALVFDHLLFPHWLSQVAEGVSSWSASRPLYLNMRSMSDLTVKGTALACDKWWLDGLSGVYHANAEN